MSVSSIDLECPWKAEYEVPSFPVDFFLVDFNYVFSCMYARTICPTAIKFAMVTYKGGLFLRVGHTPSQGAGPQQSPTFEVLLTYPFTFWRRTTRFCVVTHMGKGHDSMSSTQPISRAGPSAPNYRGSPYLCLHPLTYIVSQKNVHYLIFTNLKNPEPVYIIFGMQYPQILASKTIYNFASDLMLPYFTLQFFRVAEIMYFHVIATFVYMTFKKEDHIFKLKICICLKDTMHRSCWKKFQISFGMSEVFGHC